MKKFSILTTIVTFLALILGNLVVATDSGDACGSTWPVCNGQIIPDITDYHVIIEYSHRLMVPLLVVLTGINAIGAIIKYRKHKPVFVLAILSIILLLFQSMVGGLNVLLGTPPGFTTFDVTFSQMLLVILVLLSYSLNNKPVELDRDRWSSVSQSYRAFLIGYSVYVLQVILGAFFKHSRASNVLLDIPAMEYLIKSESIANMIYSLHWVATFVIIVAAIWFVIYASRFRYHILLSWLYLLSIVMNAAVGFVIVITGNVVLASSLHMLISTVTMAIGASILGGYWFKMRKKAAV
ncbi:COX15/CtaA family protein [Halobacillus sp. ACCC02827]|uniref:COX15/CtaA family protein n=1 Tax=Bacillaceae TaxID=186817 RepID=UPI0002A4D907|nr:MULTISPECIES: COX15/CtaA family protein [Bacillaceae]ELK47107.1 heme A synthase [Halobacillus sp. BAB-2008]QHT47636.1 heme A synthase [Bacillus sp. SB49]WJE14871.1 COX15/CtaA family protein [Halobacillus sp. ACCC02827]